MTAHIRGIPDGLRCFCNLCPYECDGLAAIAGHLAEAHGHETQRWPDGGLVIDMSEVPELIVGGEA